MSNTLQESVNAIVKDRADRTKSCLYDNHRLSSNDGRAVVLIPAAWQIRMYLPNYQVNCSAAKIGKCIKKFVADYELADKEHFYY